jgi:uncharacterized phage protein gp47/JayE
VPFDRPTLAELITRVTGDIRGRLEIAGALLRRAMADVLAKVWAGAVHMLHGHLVWASEQLFADTSEREYLVREASMYGITPTPAVFASAIVDATGVDGSVIPVDTFLARQDGARYRVTAEATISGGAAFVLVDAVEAGADSTLVATETLTFESPITGVDSEAEVNTPVVDGVDEETTDALRARLILRKREPPTGGSEQDYIGWALEVAGVTRAWVYPHEDGLGTVTVRFVRDSDVSIFPSAGEVTEVQDKLDEERPITAEVAAAAPTALSVAFTIEPTPDTSAVREAIEAELDDLFFRVAEPGDGSGGGTVLLSQIRTAIGVATGVTDYTLTVPAADVVPALGQLAVLGTVTWV